MITIKLIDSYFSSIPVHIFEHHRIRDLCGVHHEPEWYFVLEDSYNSEVIL